MILQPETVSILQNFQSINPSIIISEGTVLKTISPAETIYAKAVIPDDFPKTFGIFDLSKFLGILSLDKNSEIFFDEKHLTIKQGKSKIKYTYCNPELIVSPPDADVNLPEPYITFELKSDVLTSVMKAMAILGFNELAFSGEDGILSVQTLSSKNDSSDVYSAELGETSLTFTTIIEADKLKLINDTYKVSITKEGLTLFKCDNVEYYIANSTKSSFA